LAHLKVLMRVDYLTALLFYGGPDQIMTVTSGLASALGILLIFWNKLTGLFFPCSARFETVPLTRLLRKNLLSIRADWEPLLRKKAIVIGLDGLDPGIVDAMLGRW
jgi:hypothetical protein